MGNDLKYSNFPGFYSHAPETSSEAAQSVANAAKTREGMVRVLIGANGPRGCTADEVEATFEWERRSAAPRLSTMKARKEIVDSGLRRKGRSGRSQAAWVLPEYGPPEPADAQGDLLGAANGNIA